MIEIKTLLGDELFNLVKAKLDDKELLVNDGKLIPKHRFDFINLSLKEYKEKYEIQQNLIKNLEIKNNELLNSLNLIKQLQCENYILKHLLEAKVLNYSFVRSQLKIEELSLGSVKKVLSKRLKIIKENQPELFYESNDFFVLVPYSKINAKVFKK